MLKDPASHYAYIYRDEEGAPYYIGKGQWGRAFAPHNYPLIPLPPWERIEVIECQDSREALRLESRLIAQYRPSGKLLNARPSNTQEQNDKIKEGLEQQYRYRFTAASGHTYEPTEVMSFVAEHNLNYSAVRQVAIGNRQSHKGWRVERYASA